MANYIALLRKESKSDYGVDFPDFPGCITAGKTLEEAKDMAQEALQGHIDVMAEYGEDIPEASSLEKVMSDPDNKEAVAFLVEVRLTKVKAQRINITFPQDILRVVDNYVATHPEQNRSKVLTEAAKHYMVILKKPKPGSSQVGEVVHFKARKKAKGKRKTKELV